MFCYKNRHSHVRTSAPALIRCGRTMCFVHHETQTDDVPAGSHLVRPADPMTSHTLYYGMWDCHRAASDNRSELVTFDPQSSRRASWFFPFVTVTQRSLYRVVLKLKRILQSGCDQYLYIISNENEEVFGICSSSTASFSSSFIRPDKRFLSWCNICSTRRLEKSSGWKTSTKNHGCTDKVCINGTCRVIIL